MYLKFWSLVVYLTATSIVSTVQARCSFIPDCETCYVSTYGETREQDLWTVACKNINCLTLYPGLKSLNSSVELLDLSHSNSYFDDCLNTCNINDSNPPSVYGIDLSYSTVGLFYICLHYNGLTYFLNSLKIKLRTLRLKYARLDLYPDTLNFSSYPMLRNLDLSGTFSALRHGYISLDGATSLETLSLDNNRLSEVPSAIRNMTSLKHLSLQHNFLNRTALNKPDIFPLSLESLDISHNNFRGSADFSWMNSVNLQTLRMQNTSMGGYYLPKRLENMSNLEILDVSASVLDIDAFYFIETLSGLRIFNYSFNRLRDVPTAIQKSRLLRQLYLRSNDILYIIPGTFLNISNLSVLDLGGNRISSLPPMVFSSMKESLEVLYLDGNQLNTLEKCTILSLTRLRRLRIGGNPFHCDCKIAWLRTYREKGVDIDVENTFCNSPKEFKGMDISVFWTDGCAPSEVNFEDCFEPISPTNDPQLTGDGSMTSFTRQALASAHLAVGFSATCLVFIVVYIVVTGYRIYKRFCGKQTTTNTNSERTMFGVQNTNFTEVGETGPYQGLETVSPYQNVADGNRPTGNSYEALNPHTAI